jgi:hypothetical protein
MTATATSQNRYDVICASCGTEDQPYVVALQLPGSATVEFKSMHNKAFHSGRDTASHITYRRYDVECHECYPNGPSLNDDPLTDTDAMKVRDDHNALYHATSKDP